MSDAHAASTPKAMRGHMRMAVPWVLANATPEEEAELRATAPRLLGVIQDHLWDRRFMQVMAPLYESDG